MRIPYIGKTDYEPQTLAVTVLSMAKTRGEAGILELRNHLRNNPLAASAVIRAGAKCARKGPSWQKQAPRRARFEGQLSQWRGRDHRETHSPLNI